MNILASGMGWIDHTHGGLNRYFADYTAAMQARGHHVTGLVTAHGEETSAPPYIQEVLTRQAKVSPIARSQAFASRFRQELRTARPDVYNPHFALYASMITRNQVPADIPIVTHFHGPWAQESQVEDRGGSVGQKLRYRLKKNVEQLSYRRSDYFIVLSEYFRNILSEEYDVPAQRIHIVPGAVDIERFRPADDREAVRRQLGLLPHQPVLFCARRLVNRMGIDRLIAAMPSVVAQAPDTVLYIVGDGPQRGRLAEQIEQVEPGLDPVLAGHDGILHDSSPLSGTWVARARRPADRLSRADRSGDIGGLSGGDELQPWRQVKDAHQHVHPGHPAEERGIRAAEAGHGHRIRRQAGEDSHEGKGGRRPEGQHGCRPRHRNVLPDRRSRCAVRHFRASSSNRPDRLPPATRR